jgi:hypothetical protein
MNDKKPKKKSSKVERILLIITILGATALWIGVMYSDYYVETGDVSIKSADHANVTKIEFNYNADEVGVNIHIDENSPYIFNATWRHLYSTWETDENTEMIEIEITNTTVGDTIFINVKSNNSENDFYGTGTNIWEFDININPTYEISFKSDITTGSIDIDAEDAKFSEFNIKQTTGSIDLYLTDVIVSNDLILKSTTGSTDIYSNNLTANHVLVDMSTGSFWMNSKNDNIKTLNITQTTGSSRIRLNNGVVEDINIDGSTGSSDIIMKNVDLEGNIDVERGTGSVDVILTNITLTQDQNIDIESNTGSIDFQINQEKAIGANLTLDLESNTGSVDVYITSPLNSTKYQVEMSANTGSTELDSSTLTFAKVGTKSQSSNFAQNVDLIDITATANTGSVDIVIEDEDIHN